MLAGVYAQGLAESGQQMILVHLRVALDRFVLLDALRDLAQLGDRLVLQLLIGVRRRHGNLPGP